jgi:hypothetical protein
MNFKTFAGYAVGIFIGLGFLVGGWLLFLNGIGRPGVFIVRGTQVAGGNLQIWGGIISILMGLAVLSAIVTVAIRQWEGSEDEFSAND